MEVISKFSAEAFRYYFLRECPFPSDGEFGWGRFADVYNSELANTVGNTLSRCTTLILKNFDGVLVGSAGQTPNWDFLNTAFENKAAIVKPNVPGTVAVVRGLIEECNYSQAILNALLGVIAPTSQYLEIKAPWKLVKTDKDEAKKVLFNAVQSLRTIAILLKPFIPKSAETIYTSFNFPTPWAEVKYTDAAELRPQPDDLRVTAELVDGKVKPLFPRIG
jgi:methionyl-tRNA synthetase